MRERTRFEQELADLELRDYHLKTPTKAPPAPAGPPKIILVAGVEYPRYKKKPEKVSGKTGLWWVLSGGRTKPLRNPQSGSHWRQKCLNLAAQKLKADPQLVVYLYDFDRGTREIVTSPKGVTTTTVDIKFPTTLIDENYRRIEGDFKKPDTLILKPLTKDPISTATHPKRPYIPYCPSAHKISKGDVKMTEWIKKNNSSSWRGHGLSVRFIYEQIEKIGQNSPYTLKELHFFGHASSGTYGDRSGPSLVNTSHFGDLSKRHPLDMDPRAGLDFISATINQKNFRMAFAKGAMSYVWGCNWDVPLYRMIISLKKLLGSKKLTNDMKFKFNWAGTEEEFKTLTTRAKCSGAVWKGDKPKTVDMDGKCVSAIFRAVIADTYMQRLADASAHCVTGGIPGTYSDYDDKSEKGAPLLTHIPMGTLYCVKNAAENKDCGEDYRDVMQLYATHFGVAFNKDGADSKYGRGFALYCPQI